MHELLVYVHVSVPQGPTLDQAARCSYSLPEEPEQAQEHRSGLKKTVGTVTKTCLQCECDHVERAEFVARNISCRVWSKFSTVSH